MGAATLVVASLGSAFAQSPSAAALPFYPDPIEQPPAPTADIASYPNYGGEVDCEGQTFNGRPYSGNLKSIVATDDKTVVFTFCNPNVAFLAQAAFSSLGIDDAQYLIDHAADGSIVNQPNGTGPYKFVSWDLDQRINLTASDAYWGTAALTPNLEFQWNNDNAAKFLALSSGAVDGIDNPGKDDLPTLEGDPNFQVKPREGTNTMYFGMNNRYQPWTNQKVRQAVTMGIDRQRLVDNFFPPGTEVADYFTPCSVEFACAGAKAPAFDPVAAKALLLEGLAEEGIDIATLDIPVQYRPLARGYVNDPPGVAQDIVTQLQENLGLTAHIDEHENTTYIGESNAGSLEGLFLLGWGMDFPDTSNFLTYHFGAGTGDKFGEPYPDLVAAITTGDQSVADADRAAAYSTANDLIVEHAPVVIASHAGSATAWKADVEGAHSSPLSTEIFSVMKAGDRDILVFMQGGQPGGLYCADETDGESLRVCEQIKESLYGYEVGGLNVAPSLATECTGSEDLLTWTCTLRDGVTFHDGSPLDASDVVLSYAAQWDAISPLNVGRTGAFEYWPALLGGGFLNPAGACGMYSNVPACPAS
jgi:peptide/nickel transport system substrate-binding protein